MGKRFPDLRIPVEVYTGELEGSLSSLAKQIFVIMYNGYLELPTTTAKVIAHGEKRKVPAGKIRAALKNLCKQKFLTFKKVTVDGKRINQYRLSSTFRKVSTELKKISAQKSSDAQEKANGDYKVHSTLISSLNKNPNVPDIGHVYIKLTFYPVGVESEVNSYKYIYTKFTYFQAGTGLRASLRGINDTSTMGQVSDQQKAYTDQLLAGRKTRYSKRALRQQKARNAIIFHEKSSREEIEVDDSEWDAVMEFAGVLADKSRQYTRNPYLKNFTHKLKPQTRAYNQILKAISVATELDVSFLQYVEAQYFWFDRWFSRAPKLWEMSGGQGKMPADARVQAYIAMQDTGKLSDVVSIERKASTKVTHQEVLKYNNKLLVRMQTDGSSIEECFVQYAQPGMDVFDLVFLRQHKVYKRLVLGGMVGSN